MEQTGNEFGEYISEKRRGKGLTLRGLAQSVGISTTYLCDIEKGRRLPPGTELCEGLASALGLSGAERDRLYDLSGAQRGGVPADLPGYTTENPYMRVALRKAKDMKAGEAEWLRFIAQMDQTATSK